MLYVYIKIFKSYTLLLDKNYEIMYALFISNTARFSVTINTGITQRWPTLTPLDGHTIRMDSPE